MSNSNGSGSAGFMNGFLWGLLIGGGAVFLFGTKKGKYLLKKITEQGLESVSEIEGLVDEVEEEYEEPTSAVEEVPPSKDRPKGESSNGEAKPQSFVEKTKTTGKRFFKGIKRK